MAPNVGQTLRWQTAGNRNRIRLTTFTSKKASTSSVQSSKTKLERLRSVQEGHRRYVSKLGEEVTEILRGSEELWATRCYTTTSGRKTTVFNGNRWRNPILKRSRSDRRRNWKGRRSYICNYFSKRQNWECKQGKHANTTRGIEWSLRAFASIRAVCLFLWAKAVVKFFLRAAST